MDSSENTGAGTGAAAAKRGNLMRDLIGPAAAAGPSGFIDEVSGHIHEVSLDMLDVNPHQPRVRMDEAALKELMGSIKQQGLVHAIAVRRKGDRFEVIAGHRRTEAFRRLRDAATTDAERRRFATISAFERIATDEQMALIALVENMQRQDLSPLDAAAGLARLRTVNPRLTEAKDIAAATGLQIQKVWRLLRLNEAPAVVRDGVIGVRVANEGATDDESAERPKGGKKRQLDLHAALEFQRLHEHLLKAATKGLSAQEDEAKLRRATQGVDARVAAAILRAVDEGWAFKRVQAHVSGLISGGGGPRAAATTEASETTETTTASSPVFKMDGQQLVIYLGRLKTLDPAQRTALREAVSPVLEALGGP